VVARGQATARLADHDRGRQLFVAAGCVTCHAKVDDPQLGDRRAINVGPALTARQFPVEWLTQKIADPASLRVGTGQESVMPRLELGEREIAAVASYVNYRAQAATATVGR
jgi:mono/diheme cytochrome c family protein